MKQSRRKFMNLAATAVSGVALQHIWPAWMPRMAFANNGVAGDVIVCIFLRGGADALNMIVPFGDDDYYAARPQLAIAQPDSRSDDRALQLDDFFGLNPDMASLHELFAGGHLKAIHAVGAPHASRSHFEAMDLIERGVESEGGASSGWLGRHLSVTGSPEDSPLRAIGWEESLQTSLRGYASANAFRSITDYHLSGDATRTNQFMNTLHNLYHASDSPLEAAAQATLDTLTTVQQIDVDQYIPERGALYTETNFGRALKQTAALIKAGVGLEVACIDLGNFDTHITQGITIHQGAGIFPNLVVELADNLRAFHDDLLDEMGRVTVVTMSEFGRRVQENGAGGTDHGHGGVMFVMSEHIAGAPVHAIWPGLNANFLANGDLEITTDYRDVLGEILTKRTAGTDLQRVFPGHAYNPVDIMQ